MTANPVPTTLFINTRPACYGDDGAGGRFAAQGIAYAHLPLLTVQACALGEQDTEHLAGLLTGMYQVLVVVSPMVVAFAERALTASQWQQLQALSSQGLTVIAVGQATAQALARHGLRVEIPEIANNEGMLAMTAVSALQTGARALFWQGVGGRRLLSDALVDKGVVVDALVWYQRLMPEALVTELASLAGCWTVYQKKTVLISSALAFEHWQAACAQVGVACADFDYLALGARLAALAAAQGLMVVEIPDLQESTLLQALAGR